MTLPANIRANIGAPFPALVKGSGPITISKRAGIWTVGLTFAGLGPVPGNVLPQNLLLIVYDNTTGSFEAISVQDAIGRAVTGGTKTITFAQSPYTPKVTDTTLLVDTAGGNVVIAMPLSAQRILDLEIKDATGHAAANPISVTFLGAESCDGLTPFPIDSNYGAARLGVKANGYFNHA